MKVFAILGIIFVSEILTEVKTTNTDEVPDGYEQKKCNNTIAANNVAVKLITSVLGVDINNETNTNIEKLKQNLQKINRYTYDHEKYSEVLLNELLNIKWNHTSFYEALNENNDFSFLSEKDPKNVYYQFKKKMNRNDILKILDKNNVKLSKAYTAVNELIMEPAENKNMYNSSAFISNYWDPTEEMFQSISTRRIYKGSRTYIKYFPFMASVHIMKQFTCAGVIYSPDLILTSASCLQLMHNNRFYRENPQVLNVRIGSNHSRIGGELIPALEVFFHPGYNPRTLRCNIAAIRLERHIKFKHYRVPKMIEITPRKTAVPNEIRVILLGWGVTKIASKLRYEPVFLQRKTIPIYASIYCKQIYGNIFDLKTMFCAGSISKGDGACDHDGGGPAIYNGYLLGIISYGAEYCGAINRPTVLSHAGAFRTWVEMINSERPSYAIGYKRTTITTSRTVTVPPWLLTTTTKEQVNGSEKIDENVDETTIHNIWSTPPPDEVPPSIPPTAETTTKGKLLRNIHGMRPILRKRKSKYSRSAIKKPEQDVENDNGDEHKANHNIDTNKARDVDHKIKANGDDGNSKKGNGDDSKKGNGDDSKKGNGDDSKKGNHDVINKGNDDDSKEIANKEEADVEHKNKMNENEDEDDVKEDEKSADNEEEKTNTSDNTAKVSEKKPRADDNTDE